MIQYAYYPCPFGFLEIGWEDDSIHLIKCVENADEASISSPVSDLAATQLSEYFAGKRTDLDFPMNLKGTSFQISVWKALCRIPYGEMRSYKDIALSIGKPGAARAVGMACNRNPLWIAIPCHRVVGSNNTLTGYAGGLEMKRRLLELEQLQANSPDTSPG